MIALAVFIVWLSGVSFGVAVAREEHGHAIASGLICLAAVAIVGLSL